jgi:TfoX/Sxy family transcriptional regulator of competence genes
MRKMSTAVVAAVGAGRHTAAMAYDEALAERVREVVAAQPGLTEKRMFGGLAFLLNGHMAVSVSGQGGLLLRVDPARTDELASEPSAARFVMRGREMAGWLRIEAAGVAGDDELRRWVDVGVHYASSLPPR